LIGDYQFDMVCFPATTVVWAVNFFVKPLKLMGLLLVELVFKPPNNFHLLDSLVKAIAICNVVN
jgi:hypothetical protein